MKFRVGQIIEVGEVMGELCDNHPGAMVHYLNTGILHQAYHWEPDDTGWIDTNGPHIAPEDDSKPIKCRIYHIPYVWDSYVCLGAI